MNYYPFHIGDYASATQHLTLEEDAMYRRLLDISYTTEKPLTKDERQLFRLTRASTDTHREAVVTVLHEFFTETDEGWISPRAMAEITKMQEKQDASEERDEHEKTRMQKHRERRSAMFAQLAEVGVYPAWNAKTGELERLIAENCGKPVTTASPSDVTAPVTAPVTADVNSPSLLQRPATAIPTPTPTPTPTPNKKNSPDLLSESEPVSEFSIPLVDGTAFRVSERLVSEWRAAYPAVDVPQELREMRTWAMANRAKRKTRNGVERFAVAWLGKAQDTPSRAAGQRATGDDWTRGAT